MRRTSFAITRTWIEAFQKGKLTKIATIVCTATKAAAVAVALAALSRLRETAMVRTAQLFVIHTSNRIN